MFGTHTLEHLSAITKRPDVEIRYWYMMACRALQLGLARLVSIIAMISSSTVIAVFDPSHPGRLNILSELHYIFHEQFFKSKDPSNNVFSIPWYLQSITDPSPAVFLVAVLLFASASSNFYRLHARDSFQNHVLAGFALSGALLPILCGVKSTDLKSTWQATLPAAFTLGLISSAIGHRIWSLLPSHQNTATMDDYDFEWDRKVLAGQKLP